MSRYRARQSRYTYGVLVGKVTDGQENPGGNSPHYEILVDAAGTAYRVAVNIQSVVTQDQSSEVYAFYDRQYTDDTKLGLAALAGGPHGIAELRFGPGGNGLDYVRDNLFDLTQMRKIPADGSGISLVSILDGQVERAKADATAVVIAVGEAFDDDQTSEEVGFNLGRGVHDIHMMQGNEGRFAEDNRINGDGALFLRFAGGETAALFIRFGTQSTDTDDNGNPIG